MSFDWNVPRAHAPIVNHTQIDDHLELKMRHFLVWKSRRIEALINQRNKCEPRGFAIKTVRYSLWQVSTRKLRCAELRTQHAYSYAKAL